MYTIYHIEGVKIGCSKNPKKRVKQQGYGAFQVLEVHEDIQIASKRETELQIQYGYGKDCNTPYHISATKFGTYEGRGKGGAIGGKTTGQKNVASGHISNLGKINADKVQTCPWCFKTIKGLNYSRWHGDRCKFAW